MEPDAKKKRRRNIIICSVAGVIIFGGFWLHQENIKSSNLDKAHTELMSVKHYHHAAEHYTENKLERDYDKNEPNLGNVLAQNHDKVQKGLTLAFSECQNNASFSKHESGIKSLLGSDVGNDVINIVKPQSSSTQSRPKSVSDKLSSFNVSYGVFDSDDDIVPVMITTDFMTPKITLATQDHAHVYSGQMVISADLNVKNGTMSVNQEHAQINDQQIGDNAQNINNED